MAIQAARKTDKTTHGGFLCEGAKTVEINGQAAARLGDEHKCPLQQPATHRGGAVHIGFGAALTVLIEGQPAAVAGSAVPCVGAKALPNNVVTASPDVYYTPSSTIAGLEVRDGPDEDGPTLLVGNGIVIRGAGQYAARMLSDLAKIATTDIGRKRLHSIDESGYKVEIVYPSTKHDHTSVPEGSNDDDGSPTWLGGTGKGTNAIIQYDPHDHWPYVPEPSKTDLTSDVALFHELTHADHITHGMSDPRIHKDPWSQAIDPQTGEPKSDDWDNEEERKTITQDENLYRIQRGIKKLRDTHHEV